MWRICNSFHYTADSEFGEIRELKQEIRYKVSTKTSSFYLDVFYVMYGVAHVASKVTRNESYRSNISQP